MGSSRGEVDKEVLDDWAPSRSSLRGQMRHSSSSLDAHSVIACPPVVPQEGAEVEASAWKLDNCSRSDGILDSCMSAVCSPKSVATISVSLSHRTGQTKTN